MRPWQSHLTACEDFEEIGGVPAGTHPLGFHPTAHGVFVPQQIERGMAQEREVGGSMARAYAALILPKRQVQDPMQAVFDASVTAHGALDLPRAAGQTGEVIAHLAAHAGRARGGGAHHDQAAQARPWPAGST